MRHLMSLGLAGVTALAFVVAGGLQANEPKVNLDKVPKAVLDAVKAQFPGIKPVGASTEKENGKTVYEVTLKVKGKTVDVTVTPEGDIVLIEKEIAASELPKAVSDALMARYPKATIKLVEELSKGGKVTAYEAHIVTADNQRLEVSFDPSGKLLEEEKTGAKKKD